MDVDTFDPVRRQNVIEGLIYPSKWRAVWVCEFQDSNGRNTGHTSVAVKTPDRLGFDYAEFLGYVTGGHACIPGYPTVIYARNVDLGLR